MIPNRYIIF